MLVQCEGKGLVDCGTCHHARIHEYTDICEYNCFSYAGNSQCKEVIRKGIKYET